MFGGINFQLDLNRYRLGKILGTGAFGVVLSAEDRLLNCPVAIKQIPRMFDLSENSKVIMRELILLDNLRHPNIVSLIDVELFEENIYIITEQCQTNLQNVVQSDKYFKIKVHDQLSIMYQILKAVHFMHSAKVMHRDIKPSNILLDEKLRVKICDFGLARYYNKNNPNANDPVNLTEYVVTRWYRAPEIILNSCYGMEQDVWSVGCSFAFMCKRTAIFPGISHPNQLVVIVNILGPPNEEDLDFEISALSRRFIDNIEMENENYGLSKALDTAHHIHPLLFQLIQHMLEFNPNRRITSRLALLHPVFSSMSSTSSSSPTKSAPLPSSHLKPISSFYLEERATTTLTDNTIYTLSKISKCNSESNELKQLILSEINNLRDHLSNISKNGSQYHTANNNSDIDLKVHHCKSKEQQQLTSHRPQILMEPKKSFVRVSEEESDKVGNPGIAEREGESSPKRKRSFARIMPVSSFATTVSTTSRDSFDPLGDSSTTSTLPQCNDRSLPHLPLHRCNSKNNNSNNSNNNNINSSNKSFHQKSFTTQSSSSLKHVRAFRDTISSTNSIDAIAVEYESEEGEGDDEDTYDEFDLSLTSTNLLNEKEGGGGGYETATLFHHHHPTTSSSIRKEQQPLQQQLIKNSRRTNRPKSKSFSLSQSHSMPLPATFNESDEDEDSFDLVGTQSPGQSLSSNSSSSHKSPQKTKCLPRLSAPNIYQPSSLSTSTTTSHSPLAAIIHPMEQQQPQQQQQLPSPVPKYMISCRENTTTTTTTTSRSNSFSKEKQHIQSQQLVTTTDPYVNNNNKNNKPLHTQDCQQLTVDISEFFEETIPITIAVTTSNKLTPTADLIGLSPTTKNINDFDLKTGESLSCNKILPTMKSSKRNLTSLPLPRDISPRNHYSDTLGVNRVIPIVAPLSLPSPLPSPEKKYSDYFHDTSTTSNTLIDITSSNSSKPPKYNQHRRSRSNTSSSPNYSLIYPQNSSLLDPLPDTCRTTDTSRITDTGRTMDTSRTTDSITRSMDDIIAAARASFASMEIQKEFSGNPNPYRSTAYTSSSKQQNQQQQKSADINRRGRRQAMNTSPTMIYPEHDS